MAKTKKDNIPELTEDKQKVFNVLIDLSSPRRSSDFTPGFFAETSHEEHTKTSHVEPKKKEKFNQSCSLI